MLVGAIVPGGTCDGVLKVGDVILALDDRPVASDGFIEIEGERVEMAEVVERKFKGDPLKLHILRDKKEMDVTAQLKPAWPFLIQANTYDVKPRFVLFGGLLFQPLTRDFLEVYGIDDLRVRYFYDSFVDRAIFLQHPEVIVLSQVLPDPINTYLEQYKNSIVSEVNGHAIKRLEDLAAPSRNRRITTSSSASARAGPSCSNAPRWKPPASASRRSTTSSSESNLDQTPATPPTKPADAVVRRDTPPRRRRGPLNAFPSRFSALHDP